MPTALAGKGGSVYVPGTPTTPIASIRQWDLTILRDQYVATVLGDDWRFRVIGIGDWNGTLDGYYRITEDTTGQKVLYDSLINGVSVVLQMQVAAGGGFWEGTANIDNCAISDPADNLISIRFTFVGNGSLQSPGS